MRRAPLVLVLASLGCSSLEPLPPADHVVRAPISDRANAVLRNDVTEFGSDDGRWKGSMSPGCTVIWATEFGYRAGVRRDRDDIVAIGRVTARRASSGIFWKAIFGNIRSDDPALLGYPALLVSGKLGGRGRDAFLFEKGLGHIDQLRAGGTLRPRDQAGLAVLLSEVSRLEPGKREERLKQARACADEVQDDPVLAFLAWAAVARASGSKEDLDRGRESESRMPYRFDPGTGTLLEPAAKDEILSVHLAAIHGWADLAQATGDPGPREKAISVLAYVFSDAYFDGRFLVHDRLQGERPKEVCSGCNWMALYLVDRLYGDSFVIDPVPALPERDWPVEEEPRIPGDQPPVQGDYDRELVLEPGADGEPGHAEFVLAGIKPRGRLLFTYAGGDIHEVFEYEVLAPDAKRPLGCVELKLQAFGKEAKHTENWYTMWLPFDAAGRATLISYYGFDPLTFLAEFKRAEDGTLSATIRLR